MTLCMVSCSNHAHSALGNIEIRGDLLYSQRRHQKTQCENGGRRSTFVGNSELLPSDIIDFAMLPAQRFLAGNSFIVRCHVTSK